MRAPDFWDDQTHAQELSTRYSRLRSRLEHYDELAAQVDDLELLLDMASEETNGEGVPEELAEEVERLSGDVGRTLEQLEEQRLFTGEFDAGDAIVSIHPGAGGTESQDWAEMLLRLYLRWAQNRGFTVELNEASEGDEAGIKSVTSPCMERTPTGFSPPSGGYTGSCGSLLSIRPVGATPPSRRSM